MLALKTLSSNKWENQASVFDTFCDLLLIQSIGLHAIKLNPMTHILP
jgi:hypothetical protein